MNFKKAASLILAGAMSAMLLTSCGTPSEIPEGMQLVDNEFASYSFFVPDDWTADTTIDGFLTAKASDNSNISLQTMTWNNVYVSPDAYFQSIYRPKLESTFKTVTFLENEYDLTTATVGTVKNPACKYVYTVESDGAVYKFVQYFSLNAGYLYIFTYTGKISDTVNGEVTEFDYFADHLEELASIIGNFEF